MWRINFWERCYVNFNNAMKSLCYFVFKKCFNCRFDDIRHMSKYMLSFVIYGNKEYWKLKGSACVFHISGIIKYNQSSREDNSWKTWLLKFFYVKCFSSEITSICLKWKRDSDAKDQGRSLPCPGKILWISKNDFILFYICVYLPLCLFFHVKLLSFNKCDPS